MPKRKRFLKDKKGLTPRSWIDDILTSDGKKDLKNLGMEGVFNYPKPVKLIKRFIEIATKENDIVLDFFAGSGTTAQAANELNRKFILIEQMDYIEKITVERARKTLKDNSFFIYFELKKANGLFIHKIQKAGSAAELLAIWDDMKKHSFIKYHVEIKKMDESTGEFAQLDLKKQKELLMEILDKNQLYVNLSSLYDKDFDCTGNEIELTEKFYNMR